jgi:putative ABC transport system substrate-binding protein
MRALAQRPGRRVAIGGIVAALAAWQRAARAQPALPAVGFLSAASPAEYAHLVAAFRGGLAQVGQREGENVQIEFRWAEGRYERLPALAADLVQQRVAVIVATGAPGSVLAARAATATIPIVFTSGGDPVRLGIVESLSRPGANVTGISLFAVNLAAKRLELMAELLPEAARVGVLVNPANPNSELELPLVRDAALAHRRELVIVAASSDAELDAAFVGFAGRRVQALLVGADGFFDSRRSELVALAARHALPAIYDRREYVVAGGLASYGTSFAEAYRQAGLYAGRILSGARPEDLPVLQPTLFEMVVNLATARRLGLQVPPALLARADEVIE